MRFAEAHFALSKPDEKTGKTRLQTLLDIKKQTGLVAKELEDMPHVPYAAEHIWRWFLALSSRRTYGMGVNPITWSDINCFFSLMRISPNSWEIVAIIRLDDAYLLSKFSDSPKMIASNAKSFAESFNQVQETD